MITQIKQIAVSGVEPFTFSISSNSSCVSFPNFTYNEGILELEINITDETCFTTNPTVTIIANDANECTATETITLENNCEDIILSSITESNLLFSVTSSGCNSPEFEWNYSDTFNRVSQIDNEFGSQLILSVPSTSQSVIPTQELITVTSTCNGCEATSEYHYDLCRPNIGNLTMDAFCTFDGTWETGFYNLSVNDECSGINYNSLRFGNPANISYQINGERVKFIITNPSETSYNFTYNVASTNGILSNNASVNININECTTGRINNIPGITTVPSTVVASDIISAPISDRLVSRNLIDWSTFEILPNIPYTSPSVTTRTGTDGIQYLDYEVPVTPVTESLQYRVFDVEGNTSNAITETFIYQTDVLQAVDINSCTKAGGTFVSNFIFNDLGTINENSFQLLTIPTLGTFTVSGTTVTYIAPENYNGVQTFTYQIEDVYGYTDTATVTITILNAGVSETYNICSDGLYNYYDMLGENVTTGGTWTATVGGGPIPVSYNSDVDLTGLTGTYEYEYTVSNGDCSYKSILTIIKSAAPVAAHDECATRTFFRSVSGFVYTDNLTTQMLENCPTNQSFTESAETLPVHWSTIESDLWHGVDLTTIVGNANPITVTLSTETAGLLNPAEYVQLAIYPDCISSELTSINEVFRTTSNSSITFNNGSIPSSLVFRVGSNNPGNVKITLTVDE